MMKKGILFDLDGTLWDSSQQVLDAWNRYMREDTDRSEQFTIDDMHSFMGKTLDQIAKMMFPSLEEEERLAILKGCSQKELAYLRDLDAGRPMLYPDEERVLRELAKDYTLGVVSNCQSGYIEIYLDYVKAFADVFSDIECAGGTGLSKGENIRLVMQRQGIDECVYVGDTQGDESAAKQAGIPFIHAAYGFGTADDPAAVLDDIRGLPELIKKII